MKANHQHKTNSGPNYSRIAGSVILFAAIFLALSQAWAITLSNTGYFGAPDAIKRSFSSSSIEAGSDVTVTLTTSPGSAGKGTFYGIYMFEGHTTEQTIKGQHIVTVR